MALRVSSAESANSVSKRKRVIGVLRIVAYAGE